MRKASPLSYIELSKANLIHNIKNLKSLAKKGVRFSVAIKGNAYGHGQNEVAKILESYVDYFQVNNVQELLLLRKVSKKKTLLLGYIQKEDLAKAISLRCIIAVFSIEQLRQLNNGAGQLKIKQEIFIPFDAYLGREGFLRKDLSNVCKEIRNCKHLRFSSIYAHFANIEDTPRLTHAKKQIKEYEKALQLLRKAGFENLQTHISATSGLLAYEKDKGFHSLIRLGIGVYGMWPSEYLQTAYRNSKFSLRPVLSWKTKVVQIKILPKGSTVGYGLSYRTKKETKIAIIPQGYADGLDRRLSNKGEVLIRGTRCAILGRIHMNMSAVDVSHLAYISHEDEVVILGSQDKEQITAHEMAEKIGTINYEITTRISPLLSKVIV